MPAIIKLLFLSIILSSCSGPSRSNNNSLGNSNLRHVEINTSHAVAAHSAHMRQNTAASSSALTHLIKQHAK